MKSFLRSLVWAGVLVEMGSLQAQSPNKATPKICVATVANASTVLADRPRMTERIVKLLKRNKNDAVAMDSSTTMNRRLEPTGENNDEADSKDCEYTLLTQIVESRRHPALPPNMRYPGGPTVPSVDATDPMGGSSGPVYREEMQISFALFRARRLEPEVDDSVLETASANASDSFLRGMDRIANRVTSELKKK